MQLDSDPQSLEHAPDAPSLAQSGQPPVMDPPGSPGVASPPMLPSTPPATPSGLRLSITLLLGAGLALFIGDGLVSLLDDTLIVLFDLHLLSSVREIVFLWSMLVAGVIYCVMALSPMVPKRIFLPLTLFNLLAGLVM